MSLFTVGSEVGIVTLSKIPEREAIEQGESLPVVVFGGFL
jgi:hypothetical protein